MGGNQASGLLYVLVFFKKACTKESSPDITSNLSRKLSRSRSRTTPLWARVPCLWSCTSAPSDVQCCGVRRPRRSLTCCRKREVDVCFSRLPTGSAEKTGEQCSRASTLTSRNCRSTFQRCSMSSPLGKSTRGSCELSFQTRQTQRADTLAWLRAHTSQTFFRVLLTCLPESGKTSVVKILQKKGGSQSNHTLCESMGLL